MTEKKKNEANTSSATFDAAASEAAGVPVPAETTFEKASGAGGGDELQDLHDEAAEQGFMGEKVDPRPDSYYSLEEAGKRNEEGSK